MQYDDSRIAPISVDELFVGLGKLQGVNGAYMQP